MKSPSIRTKLTLWNVGVLALSLALLGFGVFYGARSSLLSALDKEMKSRADRFVKRIQPVTSAPPPPNNVHVQLTGVHGGKPTLAVKAGRDHFDLDLSRVGDGVYEGTYKPPPPSRDDTRSQFRARLLDMTGHTPDFLGADPPYDLASFVAAKSGVQQFTETTHDKEPIRVLTVPVREGDPKTGQIVRVLQYPQPLSETYNALSGLTTTVLIVVPLILLVAAIGGHFLAGRALKPVREITETAALVGAESLAGRLEVKGNDEFSKLAETFNGMLERLQGAFRRMEVAMDQQRRFTADASHELRTPLTVIKANTSLALKGTRAPDDYKKTLVAVHSAADTMGRMVQDLLLLARSDTGHLELQLEPVCLRQIVKEAVSAVGRPDVAEITVKLDDPNLEVLGDGHSLMRLLMNLLENAVRYTPAEGMIFVESYRDGDKAVVAVRDTGIGIGAEHLPQLTERFYRVDPARARAAGGNGLGLSICASIVEAHGGSMIISSVLDHGTTVTVRLPVAT